ncbi:MAG: hypothetical protein LC722_04200 [Actinobacteria bacterium]|nr:hypothetical protein [Actinomycetota bacterium]
MGKYLRLRDQQWTLSEETDLQALRADLIAAMGEGRAVTVSVEVDPTQAGDLLLNGRAVEAVVLWEETPAHKPSFTLID